MGVPGAPRRARRPRVADRDVPCRERGWATSSSSTTTRWISRTCSGRSCTPPPRSASPRSAPQRRPSRPSIRRSVSARSSTLSPVKGSERRSRRPTWWWRPPTASRPGAPSTGRASTPGAPSSPARSSAWKARSRSIVSTARTARATSACTGRPPRHPGTCADSGVLGSVAGIIGTVQATEVVKTLLDIGEDLDGRVLVLDALRMEWQTIRLRRNPRCPACGDRR